jgi:hypothetical protein
MENSEPEVATVARVVVGHVDRAGLADAFALAIETRDARGAA